MADSWIGEGWRRLKRAAGWRAAQSRPKAAAANGPGLGRWIVLDCETTGLNPQEDTLLSIGAVAMVDGAIRLSDRFERLLRPPSPSVVSNVLIHGIGQHAQAHAEDPSSVLKDWIDWVSHSPCIAFHARFDRSFLDRALRDHLGCTLRAPWLDLAELGPSIDPQTRARSLDDWLDRYAIRVSPRHQASADALASAMLLQRWLARLPNDERHFRALQHRARHRHRLGG